MDFLEAFLKPCTLQVVYRRWFFLGVDPQIRDATPTHLSEIVPHVDVQQTLEHKDADALQGVQDGECAGKVDVVEGKVEEAENPGGPKEEDEQDDPFEVGEQQLDVHCACVELVEDHGVEGVYEEVKVDLLIYIFWPGVP